jgi:2-polyprenyl-3-methyl-5-hydroxy-6-metoxy-1,4-benzoquinol methylase
MTSEHVSARPSERGPAVPVAPARALGWVTAPEWATGAAAASDWAAQRTPESPQTPELPHTPVDENLIDVAADLLPGKALDLGCGRGQNAIWLAQRGWVVTAVDISATALTEARAAATAAGVSIVWELADITAWRPVSRYDLVVSTFALPPRGMGRSRMLETAAAAVAPGGSILVSEFDVALAREGRMAEKHLVAAEEVERHLDGFRINRSRTRLARRPHGYEEIVVPVATVVATRRTDLRSPW